MLGSFRLRDMAKRRHYIREWRKHRGLNQEQFAERIGVTQSFVSKVENGKQSPDLSFLEVTAEALRCTPADLIMRDPTAPEAIWDIWEQLQPVQRVQLIEIGKTLKKAG